MKYLGGKSRIAKNIADVIRPQGLWWDSFCGGLSVSVALSRYGSGVVSDSCVPLISLYKAVDSGWIPPKHVSEQDWIQAKELPDTNPLKAFIGFGCSFQGMWFKSYYGPRICPPSARHPKGMKQDPVAGATKSLLRDVELLRSASCAICGMDFFDVKPEPDVFDCIYCDPPYANTTEYKYVGRFDHERFWSVCQEWARCNTKVYVSEIVCPVEHEVVWCKPFERRLGQKGQTNAAVVEKLFLIC